MKMIVSVRNTAISSLCPAESQKNSLLRIRDYPTIESAVLVQRLCA
jgi:hypothetical protein